MFNTTCKYCIHFAVTSKTGKVRKGKVFRRCPVKEKLMHNDKSACDYFGPANIFYCDIYSHQLAFANCLNRRGNRLKLKEWEDCKKCRQFEKELKGLFMEFFINGHDPITPSSYTEPKPNYSGTEKKRRVLKRRDKSPLTKALDELLPEPKRRTLKRRKPAKRKLKRRLKK